MDTTRLLRWLGGLLCAATAILTVFAEDGVRPLTRLPGQQIDGSVLLPNQWSLRPTGQQLGLGDFPVAIAMHPHQPVAAVLHCGYGQHEIIIVDYKDRRIISRTPLRESFYGITFSSDGRTLICSGASEELLHTFDIKDGYLSSPRPVPLHDRKYRGIPSGVAVDQGTGRLYAAQLFSHEIAEVVGNDPARIRHLSLKESSTNRMATSAPPENPDLAAATKRDEAVAFRTAQDDPYPYACLVDSSRQRLYVSLWGQGRVAVIDLAEWRVTAHWPTQEHPNEMVLHPQGNALFVANANRNTVTVIDPDSGHIIETLNAALFPNSPPGSTPNSLALTPDGSMLFIANACNNCVAVFDVSELGRSRSLGFIPVGWYPTSVRVSPDGQILLVANGKGNLPRSNRHGPQPSPKDPPSNVREYIGGLFQGTLSLIPIPEKKRFIQQLEATTRRAYACCPQDKGSTARRPEDHPVPRVVGQPSPIRYCLYIIKENRTYDQMLGDMPEGNGDPSLCLFPEPVTPNHHALAREFVLLDNFYVESEVSADGHEWTVGAYATDFVEKVWPLSYGHNQSGKYLYPSEGNFPIAFPAGGYLWDRAREAGVSYRSYGEFASNGKTLQDPVTARVAALEGHVDPGFRAWDMDYSDVLRAERFIQELKRFEKEGKMPQLQIIRLPNDHTYGSALGKKTPTAMVAENDLALGMLVEAVSQSRFWPETAIFVVEDDAQNGPDHVDAHRTVAYVVSPYSRRNYVDSTLYSTCSMLRTMELILGLQPMSQFDAMAQPMYASFQSMPDLRPYESLMPRADLEERNARTAWGSRQADQMDFSREDAADDLLLNQMVWRSVRGPHSTMPPPVRAAFVINREEEE